VVLDPFSGSGGLIAGARHLGAYVVAADLAPKQPRGIVPGGGGGTDVAVVDVFRSPWRRTAAWVGSNQGMATSPTAIGDNYARTRGESAASASACAVSFAPAAVRAAANTVASPASARGGGGWCDAIITDPPYGLRERRTGDANLVFAPARGQCPHLMPCAQLDLERGNHRFDLVRS
jgi:23S rRNA G2445 N2-methylase RlmL